MSVQDIIYITPLEFKSCKQNLIVCNKISSLYAKLLQGYDCFTKPDLVHLKFPTVQKPGRTDTFKTNHHNHSQQQVFNKYNKTDKKYHKGNNKFVPYHQATSSCITSDAQRPQLKALSEAQTDDDTILRRQLKGLLNIINKKNFNKIWNKIRFLANENSIQTITDVILETACSQVFYISIFMGLLCEVMTLSNEEGKVLVTKSICQFVNDYINDEQYLYKSLLATNKYHEFCLLQKHKSQATSKNHVVIELIKCGYCDEWTLQSYCDNLLRTIVNLQYDTESIDFENNIDIIISLVKDLKMKAPYVRISQTNIDNLKTLLNNSQRLKFIVEDIAKMS